MQTHCKHIFDILIRRERPLVMAIINVTPDSFSDTEHCLTEEKILALAEQHVLAGADMIDIGGYSTRPGADEVTPEEEWRRVQLAATVIRRRFPDITLSVDTFRADVAEKAVTLCDVDIINDISGGQLDPEMFATVARLRAPYILTHTRGTPSTMQQLTDYADVVNDVKAFFAEKVAELNHLGVEHIVLDPGFGFAKTLEQNYQLLSRMTELADLGYPILAGVSHKSMIYKPLGIAPHQTLVPTSALHMACLERGADIIRVHEAMEAVQVVKLYSLLNQ